MPQGACLYRRTSNSRMMAFYIGTLMPFLLSSLRGKVPSARCSSRERRVSIPAYRQCVASNTTSVGGGTTCILICLANRDNCRVHIRCCIRIALLFSSPPFSPRARALAHHFQRRKRSKDINRTSGHKLSEQEERRRGGNKEEGGTKEDTSRQGTPDGEAGLQ